MHQERQGVRSTKIKIENVNKDPTQSTQQKEKEIFVKVENMETIYSDQTGKFPVT